MIGILKVLALAGGNVTQALGLVGRRTLRQPKTRNPTDPQQAYLIARAEAKRARRAKARHRHALHLVNTCRAWFNPLATDGCINGCKKSLYPFYVNRSK